MARVNPANAFLNKMFAYLSNKVITVPTDFRDQCIAINDLLADERTGLVNSILDFAINSACVDFTVETSNSALSDIMNKWIQDINVALIGKIPTGVGALAKEYYRERWKGSSFILMRSIWEEKDGFILPTKIWFVDGKDISINGTDDTKKELGKETYELVISKDNTIKLPTSKDEKLFIQKPYERWDADYPTPFLIKRGIYYNAKLLELLISKGENIIGKAIEYLMLMKKGSAELVKMNRPEFTYSKEDFEAIKTMFETMLEKKREEGGIPSYYTNFDTDLEHLIPDYGKAIKDEVYSPIEKRILAGLGFIEIIEGVTSSRKEAVLNPKVFVNEVQSAVNDFKVILIDILKTIIILNKESRKKYTNVDYIQIRSTPIKSFMTEETKVLLRSFYDRGLLSKRTAVEIGLDIDFDAEIERRKVEKDDDLEALMFAPVVQNNGQAVAPGTTDKTPTPDKTGPEAKNFNQATVYEQAPYKTIEDLPVQVKVLPKSAQKLFMRVFNENYDKGEEAAFKIAWSVVKLTYKKSGDKWLKKASEEIEEALRTMSLDEIVEIKKLEVLNKQTKLLDEIMKAKEEETTNENS